MLWLVITVAVIAAALLAAALYDRKERRLGHHFRSTGQVSRESLRYREVFEHPSSTADPKLPNSVAEARWGHQHDRDRRDR